MRSFALSPRSSLRWKHCRHSVSRNFVDTSEHRVARRASSSAPSKPCQGFVISISFRCFRSTEKFPSSFSNRWKNRRCNSSSMNCWIGTTSHSRMSIARSISVHCKCLLRDCWNTSKDSRCGDFYTFSWLSELSVPLQKEPAALWARVISRRPSRSGFSRICGPSVESSSRISRRNSFDTQSCFFCSHASAQLLT